MFDPEVLQILGLNLMSQRSPNFGEALGNAGLATMQYQRQREEDKYRKEERDFMRQQRQRQQQFESAREALAPQYFSPSAPPLEYTDTVGDQLPQPPIPGAPPKMDMEGYANALMGLGSQGIKESMAIRQSMQQKTPIGQVDPDKFTPESLSRFKMTGRYEDLVPQREQWSSMSAEEVARLGLPPGGYQRNTLTGRIDAFGRPPVSVTTNVNTPKETFQTSLALKKDFDGQPTVRGYSEVRQAWDQISTALANPSGANDLAAATKFMKLLDPGSVVRESELAMAMQATGALDRFMNYHNQLINGQKLTPKQREEFLQAGKALHDAAKKRYDETVAQYHGIARQYGLDPQFIARSANPLIRNATKLVEGRQAIARGVPREEVIRRLVEAGFDPEGL